MSYNKRTWATGNVVGAVDLNRMEQGIEDASGGGAEPFIIREVYNEGTDTTEYIANYSYYDASEGTPAYLQGGGRDTLIPLIDQGTYLAYLSLNPFSEPSLYCCVLTLDGDDDTGLRFNASFFAADLTFTEET